MGRSLSLLSAAKTLNLGGPTDLRLRFTCTLARLRLQYVARLEGLSVYWCMHTYIYIYDISQAAQQGIPTVARREAESTWIVVDSC